MSFSLRAAFIASLISPRKQTTAHTAALFAKDDIVQWTVAESISIEPSATAGSKDWSSVASSSSSLATINRPVCSMTCFSIKAPLGSAVTPRKRVGA